MVRERRAFEGGQIRRPCRCDRQDTPRFAQSGRSARGGKTQVRSSRSAAVAACPHEPRLIPRISPGCAIVTTGEEAAGRLDVMVGSPMATVLFFVAAAGRQCEL